MKKVLLFCLFAILFASCGAQKRKAKDFVDVLEAETGDDWKIVKTITEEENYSVFKNTKTGEQVAYNLKDFDRKDDNYQDYLAKIDPETDIRGNLSKYQQWESELQSYTYTEYEWEYGQDANGEYHWVEVPITYTDYYYEDVLRTYYTDGSYTFQMGQNTGKDLETIGGIVEQSSLNEVATLFSSKYGLSESRGLEVAKLVKAYDQISKHRNMTDADKKAFETELLGTDLKEFEEVYKASKQGEKVDQFKLLIESAAKLNEIAPEHFMQIMSDVVQ